MTRLRRLARDHASLAALLLAAALLLRLLMPAGFMPVADGAGRLTVMVCSGEGSRAMTIAIPGLGERPAKPGPQERDKAGGPCAFGSLTAPFLGGVDSVLLVAALAVAACWRASDGRAVSRRLALASGRRACWCCRSLPGSPSRVGCTCTSRRSSARSMPNG
ncbi:hypothetical protein [Sphingomonas sp. IW22]|uniref:hypothetical protein n=1 Tax=Sphingomonas sp. IW22 TaxID=3242489 RepID=UPI0035221E94